jgi:membrane dipeptidase
MLSRADYVKLPLKERLIKTSKTEEERATVLHEKLPLVDLHSHIVFPHREDFDRQRVRNSGVTCFVEAVAVLSENFYESVRELGSVFSFVKKQPDMGLAFSAEDIRRAKREGKQVVMAQFEPQTIGLDLNNVTILNGLGVRMMLLTFNTRNYIGDGCAENQDTGLSYFGFDVVKKMNEEGMMIDLSHCGDQTTLDTIEASKDPVLFNHTGARALNPKCTRLKTEEQIKALAEKGGLMGISAVPNQLSNAKRQGIQDLLNHVDCVVKLVGVDHVAIGLDKVFGDQVANHRRMMAQGLIDPAKAGMELNAEYMEGIESPEEWPNITRGLVSRGYSDQEIEKIVGGNALRIMEQVIG